MQKNQPILLQGNVVFIQVVQKLAAGCKYKFITNVNCDVKLSQKEIKMQMICFKEMNYL